MGLSACATPANRPTAPLARTDFRTNRSPASVLADAGLTCLVDTEVFRDYGKQEDLLEAIDPKFAEAYRSAKYEDKPRLLALALAESFAYGQRLLDQYERYLDRGMTLDQISRKSTVYAELQALYFFQHDLERFAASDIASVVTGALSAIPEEQHRFNGMRTGALGIIESSQMYVRNMKRYIDERVSRPEYATLALAHIEDALDDLEATSLDCGSDGRSHVFQSSSNHDAIAAAKALPRDRTTYKKFQPKADENGVKSVSVESIIKARGAALFTSWISVIDREPQSVPVGKVIYPDAGKAGNIFGTNFPKGVWALTFDDGPHGGNRTEPSYTKQVLENLDHHGMKATFFVLSQQIERADCPGVGPRSERVVGRSGRVSTHEINIMKSRPERVFPELALAEKAAGHAVASHSYYHSQVPKDNDVEQECELIRAPEVFATKLGYHPDFFRLPYGAGVSIAKVREKIAAGGMVHVHWSVDTLDWQDHDPDSIVRRAIKAIKNGGRGIILFHDVHPQSVIASEKIMAYLKDPANGIETVTVPQIVDRLNGVR
jgi:peptidoglycan/xylan/chitin deacetylase (PgdA/CDA1 family)